MANAQKKVEEIDRLRANYYGELDEKVWGQADNYDVCLNISAIDEAGAVYMIEKAVEGKLIQMDLKAAQQTEYRDAKTRPKRPRFSSLSS